MWFVLCQVYPQKVVKKKKKSGISWKRNSLLGRDHCGHQNSFCILTECTIIRRIRSPLPLPRPRPAPQSSTPTPRSLEPSHWALADEINEMWQKRWISLPSWAKSAFSIITRSFKPCFYHVAITQRILGPTEPQTGIAQNPGPQGEAGRPGETLRHARPPCAVSGA